MRALILSLGVLFAAVQDAAANSPDPEPSTPFSEAVEAFRGADYPRAVIIFETLARSGDAQAAYNLALLYKRGWGRPQNFRDALFWAWASWLGGVREAADLAEGLKQMVPADVRQAASDRLVAVLAARLDAGDTTAILQYARLHADILEEPDLRNAFVWYAIAGALGISGSDQPMARISAQFAPPELVEAQDLAAQIFAKSRFAYPAPQQGQLGE